jgi:hypothetical protein
MTTIDASAHRSGSPGPGGDRRRTADPAPDPAADLAPTVEFALADLDPAHDPADGATDPHAHRIP